MQFTDEATFHNCGFVNKRNFHHSDNENPHIIRTIDRQHRWSINVWGGIINNFVVGPYFFEEYLNGETYLHFLRNAFQDIIDNLPLDVTRRMWFQQDGAPPHYSREVREYLNEEFPNRWIGRSGPVNWPPRSPDLTKMDFFLWGYITLHS